MYQGILKIKKGDEVMAEIIIKDGMITATCKEGFGDNFEYQGQEMNIGELKDFKILPIPTES